jgi:hypothetical protein
MPHLVCRFVIPDLIRVDIAVGKKFANGGRHSNGRLLEVLKLKKVDVDAWLNNVTVTIDELPVQWRELRKEAQKHGVNRHGSSFYLSYNAIVAYVRHNRTNYEFLLGELECLPGGRAVYYESLKEHVDTIIRTALQEQYGSSVKAS